MRTIKSYPEVRGTRTGYMIRYTCPACIAESVIVNNSPKDHFKRTRTVTCRYCRTRMTVLTPGRES
jgi:DNA-directed RNA polymerase subunit RPC12/RpoP